MLRRALDSLKSQSYPHWKAIVLDDSLSPDSRHIVRCASDDRISYLRNPGRLGAAKNIDQCFSSKSLLGGNYACLLEDDNFWFPDFLSLVAESLEKKSWELILANQRINEEGAGLRPAKETTRGRWFSAGSVNPLELRARLLLMEGLSNGGLVWRLNSQVNLQVDHNVRETGLQEACRSLLVAVPFLFISEPLAVWTSMPKADTARASEGYRTFGRGMQSIREFILRVHGKSLVWLARAVAEELELTDRLIEALSYSGYPSLAEKLIKRKRLLACRAFAKGLAIRFVENDPCAGFLSSRPLKGIS
jgi:glycosyltransferase involved in cell wall biosynthesis